MTNKQQQTINQLLAALENQIIFKAGTSVQYTNIRLLQDSKTNDVFIAFTKTIIKEDIDSKNIYWKIDINGNLDDNASENMQFNSISERVNYFENLKPIKI